MTDFTNYKDTLAEMDESIERMEQQLIQLRVRRNMIVPINRTPRELLQEIMHYVKGDDAVEGHMESSFMKLEQVCQYWREVVLEYPTLWTKLELHHKFDLLRLKEVLRRSKSSPLWVQWRYRGKPVEGFGRELASVIQGQQHRIQILEINESYYSTRVQGGFTYYLMESKNWPSLESLKIRIMTGTREVIMLTNDLSIPKLRSLSVERYWDPTLLVPSLQELQIISPNTRLQFNQLSSLLSSLPNLQELDLRDALLEVQGEHWDSYTLGQGPIQIRSLRKLILHSYNCSTVAAFLSRIALHDGVALHLHSRNARNDPFLDKIAFKALRTKPVLTCMASRFSLGLDHHSTSSTFTFSDLPTNQIWFKITIPGTDNEVSYSMISAISLENLVSCSISTTCRKLEERVVRTLSTGTTLEVITLGPGFSNDGNRDFIDDMANCIPQCNVHQQAGQEQAELVESKRYALPRSYPHPCKECQELGKSFFPALRKIVLPHTGMRTRSLPRFIVGRIRCGLRIEEIFIDDSVRSRRLEMFRLKYLELCNDFGPSVKARNIGIEEYSDGFENWDEWDEGDEGDKRDDD